MPCNCLHGSVRRDVWGACVPYPLKISPCYRDSFADITMRPQKKEDFFLALHVSVTNSMRLCAKECADMIPSPFLKSPPPDTTMRRCRRRQIARPPPPPHLVDSSTVFQCACQPPHGCPFSLSYCSGDDAVTATVLPALLTSPHLLWGPALPPREVLRHFWAQAIAPPQPSRKRKHNPVVWEPVVVHPIGTTKATRVTSQPPAETSAPGCKVDVLPQENRPVNEGCRLSEAFHTLSAVVMQTPEKENTMDHRYRRAAVSSESEPKRRRRLHCKNERIPDGPSPVSACCPREGYILPCGALPTTCRADAIAVAKLLAYYRVLRQVETHSVFAADSHCAVKL